MEMSAAAGTRARGPRTVGGSAKTSSKVRSFVVQLMSDEDLEKIAACHLRAPLARRRIGRARMSLNNDQAYSTGLVFVHTHTESRLQAALVVILVGRSSFSSPPPL